MELEDVKVGMMVEVLGDGMAKVARVTAVGERRVLIFDDTRGDEAIISPTYLSPRKPPRAGDTVRVHLNTPAEREAIVTWGFAGFPDGHPLAGTFVLAPAGEGISWRRVSRG